MSAKQRELESMARAAGRSAAALVARQGWQCSPQAAADRFGYAVSVSSPSGKYLERVAFIDGFCEARRDGAS